MKHRYIIILLVIMSISIPSFGNIFSDKNKLQDTKNFEICNVEKVVDGDTIVVNTGYESFPIRLYGIDCMETSKNHRAYHQAYDNNIKIGQVISNGNKATNELKRIIKENHNTLYFKTSGIDKYSRLLGILYDKNFNNINSQMKQYCEAYKPTLKK